MPAARKIAALMEQLTPDDVAALAPAERERFAFLCSRWCTVARTGAARPPKSGVLADVRRHGVHAE